MRIDGKSGTRAQDACDADIIQIGKPILIYDPCGGLSLGFGARYLTISGDRRRRPCGSFRQRLSS
jgi:hypothetical protein